MELKIAQNSMGRYNLMSNKESMAFSMAIYGDDGKVLSINGHNCILSYSSEDDETSDFEDGIENLGWIFGKCLEYAKRVWGTTNYEAQCIAFIQAYNDNFRELEQSYINAQKTLLEKKLEQIKSRLNSIYFPDCRDEFKAPIEKEIAKFEGWIEKKNQEIDQYKEGSENRIKLEQQNEKYKEHIKSLQIVLAGF